jgi:hypothetical protein
LKNKEIEETPEKTRLFKARGEKVSSDVETPTSLQKLLTHEHIGTKIINSDFQIRSIFDKYEYEPNEIAYLFSEWGDVEFMDPSYSNLKNLISSDLDVDRLDYLLRDAHYMGLPYGSTDFDYILAHMRFEKGDGEADRLKVAKQMRYFNSADYSTHTYSDLQTIHGEDCHLSGFCDCPVCKSHNINEIVENYEKTLPNTRTHQTISYLNEASVFQDKIKNNESKTYIDSKKYAKQILSSYAE